jgi:predicted amidohydrolase YtcJ
MRKLYFLIILFPLLQSCYKGQAVDMIVHNARIHDIIDTTIVHDAMAIRDGKIIEVGPERQILNKYSAEEEIDAEGKDVFPGFTDAHGHLISYAKQKLSVDLVGSKSIDEVFVRLEKYQQQFKRKFIVGRGWDQSLWGDKNFPTNEKLNQIFPDIPVCLFRIDGHALLANDACLKLAGITEKSKIDGGIIELKNNVCTGILVDNAMNPVFEKLPDYPFNELKTKILEIQEELFQYGITGVHEAGIENEHITMFNEMVKDKTLKLNLYAMLLPSDANIAFARKNGVYQNQNLLIRSFKVFGDGALGSRGAFLKLPYSDHANHHGVLTTTVEEMNRIANVCMEVGYQMNTHAIGDSTNRILFDIYKQVFSKIKDHRWRIEHAQVLDPKDFHFFGANAVIPSVQPTHAITDMRWAEQRLGKGRMEGAYAYKSLLKQIGIMAIGTDFPIENIDPFRTINAAVNRKDENNLPEGGFYPNEAISLMDCIKGMTLDAAFASFQEEYLGTLVAGKDATFIILDKPLSQSSYQSNQSRLTVIKGQIVYQAL